jgi:hypothetical protein
VKGSKMSAKAFLLVLAAMALFAAPAEAKHAQRLPDLQVSAASYTPKSGYAYQGEPASQIRFCERTKNIGTAKTPRRLHNVMRLQGPGAFREVVARRDVPRLAPGESHYGCARGLHAPLDLPPGGYQVQICADLRLKDRDHTNNCRGCKESKCFFVIKRSWTGAVSGTGEWGISEPVSESWQTNPGTTFKLAQVLRPGYFKYTMAGSVSYKDAPSSGGCDHSGAGTDVSPTARFELDYGNDTYIGFGQASTAFRYALPNSCGPTDYGPGFPVFLYTGFGTNGPTALPFGSEQVSGSFTDESGSTIFWTLN